MNEIHIFSYTRWYPFTFLGLSHPLWSVHQETIIATWIVLGILLLLSLAVRAALARKNKLVIHAVATLVRGGVELCTQTMGFFHKGHITFLLSLFTFILCCNTITAYLPWFAEPTSDVNTTLALGLISFFYIQIAIIKAHGIRGYLKEFLTPVFMFPLHVIGKLATIISISFRLFGNIFGGTIITDIYSGMKASFLGELLGIFSGLNLAITIFFGLFEGLIQALVFFMLSLTYLSIGLQEEDHD